MIAKRTIDAAEKSARTAIERASLETQEKIMGGGLTSAAAREFLAGIPTAEMLMKPLDVGEVRAMTATTVRGLIGDYRYE